MKFARIEMLFLIWAVPLMLLVFIYGMKNRQKSLSRFSSPRGLSAVAADADPNRRQIKVGLMLFALLFLSFASAGPQYGYKWQEMERKGIDILIALDCSKSMLAADINPTRLDRAKREVYDLLALLKGDRIGLVAFAGTAFLQCPLTLDYDAFNIFLNALSPDFLPLGGSDLPEALLTSLAGFDKKINSEKAVILITDGENTGSEDPIKTAEELGKAGVKLFCIGVGSGEGVPVPDEKGGFRKDRSGQIVLTRLDEDSLKKMAVLTGGAYIRSVAGDMDLDLIYTKEIRGKMESATLSTGRKQIWEDRYQWFLAVAIIALIAEIFLPKTKFSEKTIFFMLIALIMTTSAASAADPAREGLEAYQKGDYEKALKLFIDAQLESPDKPEILYNIGNTYYKTGEFESAQKNYSQAMKTQNPSLRQKTLYNLGNCNYRKGDYEAAVKNYEESLKLSPNDEQAKQNLEFVKTVMAQKKEEQKQQSEGDKKKEDSQEKKEEKSSESQKNESEKKDSENKDSAQSDKKESAGEDEKSEPQKKFGNELNEEQKPDSAQAAKPADEDKKDEKSSASGAKPADESGESDQKKQAERMLNRLNDQPGKAMIPFYKKKEVEKDW